jgi:hypothetical protein
MAANGQKTGTIGTCSPLVVTAYRGGKNLPRKINFRIFSEILRHYLTGVLSLGTELYPPFKRKIQFHLAIK